MESVGESEIVYESVDVINPYHANVENRVSF